MEKSQVRDKPVVCCPPCRKTHVCLKRDDGRPSPEWPPLRTLPRGQHAPKTGSTAPFGAQHTAPPGQGSVAWCTHPGTVQRKMRVPCKGASVGGGGDAFDTLLHLSYRGGDVQKTAHTGIATPCAVSLTCQQLTNRAQLPAQCLKPLGFIADI